MTKPRLLVAVTLAAGLSVAAGLVWQASGERTAAGAPLTTAMRPPVLSLTAAQTPAGPVRLAWRWQGEGPPPGEMKLVRALHPDGLLSSGEDVHPAARWMLPGGREGGFVDAAPADGVAYLYQASAGALTSGVVRIVTAERPLPATVRAPMLRVDKATYVMALVDGGQVIRRFPIAIGRAPKRRKLHFDNASTPEGVYHVVGVQPRATFYKAFDLDYPTALDRVRYAVARAGRPDLPAIGGEIQIHAGGGTQTNWTYGCMALRDADIDALFARNAVRRGTEVRIWGGELTEAEVDAMATPPDPAALRRWRAALAARGFVTDGAWGPALWSAIGRYQRAEGLPATCWPDAVTGRRLGLVRSPEP